MNLDLDPRLQQNYGGEDVYDASLPDFAEEEREARKRLMRSRRSGWTIAALSVGVAVAGGAAAVALGVVPPVSFPSLSSLRISEPVSGAPSPGIRTSTIAQVNGRSDPDQAGGQKLATAIERTAAPVSPAPATPVADEQPRQVAAAEPNMVKLDVAERPATPPVVLPGPPVLPEPPPAAVAAKEEAPLVKPEPPRAAAPQAVEQSQTGAIRRKPDEPRPAVVLTSGEAAKLVALSRTKIKQGDIAGARRLLERAAAADDPEALFALAETYDAAVLARWGVIGVKPDGAMARSLYGKAAAKGGGTAQRALAAIAAAERQDQPASDRVAP